MDLHIVLVGAGVFVVSAVVIYLISAFTMKEKTFEEVIAEQKRRQEEEREKAKLDKKLDKDSKRPHKKKGKTKEKSSPSSSPTASQPSPPTPAVEEEIKDHKMVNLELEPEIIEPLEAKQVSPKTAKKKDKAVKPILHNKDEKTPVSEGKVVEMEHTIQTPKDDLELKHLREKKPKEKKPKQEPEMKQAKPVVEEIVMKNVSKVQAAAPPQPQSSPKAVPKEKTADSGISNAKLLSSVKSASLNESELQAMIDVLLNKQGGRGAAAATSDWNKKSQKGDPVALLRKQLEEKERSLQEEQQIAMAANTRLKELNQEKNRYQAVEKSYKDKIDYQAQEIQALHNRMHQTHEQHMVETSQFRARVQQLEGQVGDQSQVKRLADENKMLMDTLAKTKAESVPKSDVNSLKQKVNIMETELSSNVVKLNASDNAKKALEQKVAKYEAELKKLENVQQSESVYEKRLEEVNKELRKSEAKNTSLNKDLQAAKKAVDTTHNEVVVLKSKLQELESALNGSDHTSREMEEKLKEAERMKLDMEGNLKNLQKKVQDTEKDKTELTNEIKTLRQENGVLSDELKTVKEKHQEAPPSAPNGDMHAEDTSSTKIAITEHEKILSDKDSEISRLVSEIEKRKSEFSAIQLEVEAQKKKNNELREKNWKAMDALEKSEKSVSESVKSALKDVREEQATKQKELEMFDQSVLQRIFPRVTVSNVSVHKDWMTNFEKEACNELSGLKKAPNSDNSEKYECQIREMEQQVKNMEGQVRAAEESRGQLQSSMAESTENCNKLTSQVAQYRSVLAETENKLTQLENSVESEEKKWQERLQNSELELEQAKSEMANLREELLRSRGSQEMKTKVEDLENQLKESQSQCSQLQSQVTEAESSVSSLQDQLLEVKSASANLTNVQSDLDELRRQLEAEKKKNKELASNVVKLNGIIKTGHDALTQEQQLVEKLRKELESQNPDSVPKESKTETAKMKDRIAELEKQLEKEFSSNKLLTQRLAASQGSLNEAGTSV